MMLVEFYDFLHEPLAMALCLFGIVGHCFSTAILSKMLNPTNLLLISMSGTLYKYGSEELCISALWSFGWTSTLLVSVNVSVIVHMLGVFHVVALSIVRYMSLRQLSNSTSSVQWFDFKKCYKTLITIYCLVLTVCGPIYFHSHIAQADQPDPSCVERDPSVANVTVHQLEFSSNEQLQQLNFWLFGSICKLVPCSILSLMTVLILNELKKIRILSARFKNVERDRQYHRTTNMILVIMVVFIIVEFPQGVMAVAQTLVDIPYMDTWGDLFESLTLLTSCVIFGLFFTMNSRLRDAFLKTMDELCPHCRIFKVAKQIHFPFSNITTTTPETKRLVQNGLCRNYGDTDV